MAAYAVAKSPPDGYTLLSGFHGVLAILQHLQKLPYDPQKDLVPIIHIATVPNILLINSGLDIGSLKDLIAYAKANPGKLTYASQGNGSSGHMAGEQFKLATGVDIVHVPYRGAAPAVQDLLAGHVSMMFDVVALALPQLASGKVRALGVAAPQRVAALPDVPTLAEAGLPGVEGGAFFGLVAPAGTRPEIVEWLNRAGNKVFSDAKIRDQYISQGAILPLGKPEAFAAYIANESNRWGDVISRGGIRLQ